ncbi:MAG TPA: tetratricopeptide repeat protein, partial [Ardenticatenaceae bacterium]
MTSQSIQLYLERLQADDLLRKARRILLPVTLSPAILESEQARFQRRGEALDIEAFLDHFRPDNDPNGPLVRHSSAVVVSALGGGKSTLFRALTWEAAQRALEESSAPIPFYLPLARLGDTGEALLMNALWHIGLPISRATLRESLEEGSRSLFFLLDPSPSFTANGSAEALDNVIRELEQDWPGCRWVVALRPDTALALPTAWQHRRYYMLDPLPPSVALSNLLRELAPAAQKALELMVATVPGLAALVQRPAIAEQLREIVQQFGGEDGHKWLSELVFSLLNRAGDVEMPRAKALETLQALALGENEGPVSAHEAARLAGKSLPQFLEAGVLDALLVGDGTTSMQHYRFADPSLRKLVLWLADPEAYSKPERRPEPEAAPIPAKLAEPVVTTRAKAETFVPSQTTADLVEAWEKAAGANDLNQLVEIQRQLSHLQAETLHQIAQTHQAAARLDEAATQVRLALEHQPDNQRFRVTLGTIQAMAEQHEEARRTLEMALPHAPSGLGYFYLGRAYEALGWGAEAFQAFQQAAVMESAEQATAAAAAAGLAPDRETTMRLWEQALALQPGRADWHVQLGRLREEAGDSEGAQLCYQHALEAHPNEAEAHHNLGLLLLNQGQCELALQHLRRASVAQPKEANWLVDLGNALEATDDPKGAEEAYRRALRLEPRATRPFASLGSLLRREKRYDEALPALKQALALDGDQMEVLFELGLLCEVKGDMAQALSAYRRAAQLDPTSPRIRTQLGAVHRQLGQPEEARQWLQEALDLNPRYGRAY